MSEITNFRGEASTEQGTHADQLVDALMSRVGERVRKARELKGIPRRILSEVSGVSPRYLAQLEAGEGNISIGLLQRVAVALDYPIDWLITEEDPWTSDVLKAAELFRSSPANIRAQVLGLLVPEPPESRRANRICLVGLRGAGKSTLGAAVGRLIGVPFVELNKEIEEQAGMPVNEVLALYGQEGYRRLEAQAIQRITATYDSLILAVAGGIVADPATYNHLLAHFHTVWIKAQAQDHMSRVRAQGDTRPMAGNPEAMDQLKSILTSREALYAKAQAQLDTSGKTVEQSANELVELISNRHFLD